VERDVMPRTFEDLLRGKPVFISLGVREFGESLRRAGYNVVDVDWSPPAGGDSKMAALLDDLL
jgi:FdrA protein